MTREELIAEASKNHDELARHYYSGETELSKAEFDEWHARIWRGLAIDLIEQGLSDAPGPTLEDRVYMLEELIARLKVDNNLS